MANGEEQEKAELQRDLQFARKARQSQEAAAAQQAAAQRKARSPLRKIAFGSPLEKLVGALQFGRDNAVGIAQGLSLTATLGPSASDTLEKYIGSGDPALGALSAASYLLPQNWYGFGARILATGMGVHRTFFEGDPAGVQLLSTALPMVTNAATLLRRDIPRFRENERSNPVSEVATDLAALGTGIRYTAGLKVEGIANAFHATKSALQTTYLELGMIAGSFMSRRFNYVGPMTTLAVSAGRALLGIDIIQDLAIELPEAMDKDYKNLMDGEWSEGSIFEGTYVGSALDYIGNSPVGSFLEGVGNTWDNFKGASSEFLSDSFVGGAWDRTADTWQELSSGTLEELVGDTAAEQTLYKSLDIAFDSLLYSRLYHDDKAHNIRVNQQIKEATGKDFGDKDMVHDLFAAPKYAFDWIRNLGAMNSPKGKYITTPYERFYVGSNLIEYGFATATVGAAATLVGAALFGIPIALVGATVAGRGVYKVVDKVTETQQAAQNTTIGLPRSPPIPTPSKPKWYNPKRYIPRRFRRRNAPASAIPPPPPATAGTTPSPGGTRPVGTGTRQQPGVGNVPLQGRGAPAFTGIPTLEEVAAGAPSFTAAETLYAFFHDDKRTRPQAEALRERAYKARELFIDTRQQVVDYLVDRSLPGGKAFQDLGEYIQQHESLLDATPEEVAFNPAGYSNRLAQVAVHARKQLEEYVHEVQSMMPNQTYAFIVNETGNHDTAKQEAEIIDQLRDGRQVLEANIASLQNVPAEVLDKLGRFDTVLNDLYTPDGQYEMRRNTLVRSLGEVDMHLRSTPRGPDTP
ncbi:MAG: hypothetical protein OXR66_02065 [Candidatus Woesearchaeota archaeon]|nr:hypothetical protein [Candidatus Woesearchaeota archaeon]